MLRESKKTVGKPNGSAVALQVGRNVRRLRQEQHDTRLRTIQQAISEATIAGDQEALVALTTLLPGLLAARRNFDPPASPYFRDTRSVVERR